MDQKLREKHIFIRINFPITTRWLEEMEGAMSFTVTKTKDHDDIIDFKKIDKEGMNAWEFKKYANQDLKAKIMNFIGNSLDEYINEV